MPFATIKKLVRGLARTREGIAASLRSAFASHAVDEAALDDLETSLLAADLGPALTEEILGGVRQRAREGALDGEGLRDALRSALRGALGEAPAADEPQAAPRVVFVVGVNGGGKTTTIGKLAARERAAGRRVMVVAADTFRAAAIDQLERWAERAGVEVVRHREGSDPSAVVFDALQAARARKIDTVLVDTAGRLHTKSPLMAELSKMARIAGREIPGAPHEVLLVIDATTGQNGLAQAREFAKSAVTTGVVLTKLDGTAKGGVALVIRRQLGVPIRYVGVGEGIDDLLDFDAEAYVDGLLGGGSRMTDQEGMAQALVLAALGEGTTRPNPLVGCVVVNGGEVVGRGFHRAAGEPHAECLALAEAGATARGATLYVNLEPCAHHGRTAPCVEAIVRAGIRRVVAAIGDPNPLVDGRGLIALRAAGISVTEGVLATDARALNAPFLSTHQRHRPWVTIKAAQSLDGRIAAAGGRSAWVSGEASRRFAHRLRFRHDAVLVGARTVRRDDPSLTVRLPGIDAERMRVVLAPRLGLDPAAKIFRRESASAPKARVYVGAACPAAEAARLQDVAEIVPVAEGAGGLDLSAVLADLGKAGVQSILVEGGGKTSGAFLSRGLVDEIVLFIAGKLFGAGDATPVVDVPAAPDPATAWRVAPASFIPLGPDLIVIGRVGAA